MAVEYSDIPAYLTYLLPHPTSSYTGFFCHPTPTRSYLILPHPTLDSSTILPRPTLSYPILPHPTSSYWILLPAYPYPVLPYPTPSYTLFYCHPTASYLVLHWMLLPSYPVLLYPIPLYHILPRPGVGQGRMAEESRV